MKRRLLIGGVLLITLLIGIGIGSSGKTKTAASTTVTARQTTTVTTSTRSARSNTKISVPGDCIGAISQARRVVGILSNAVGIAAKEVNLIGPAITDASSGDSSGVSTITSEYQRANTEIGALTPKLHLELALFDSLAAGCHKP